jgi:uncharacterized protein (TIGR02246 family)
MILPLMLSFAVACQPPQPQATATGPDVEAVTAFVATYTAAVEAEDMETWQTLRTSDMIAFPPDAPPFVGLETLRSWAEGTFATTSTTFTAQPEDVLVAGDLATVRASYTQIVTPNDGDAMELSGTWLMVLRKQPDGSWKVWRDMWSVVAPPDTPET